MKITLKWNGKEFKDVDVDVTKTLVDFKTDLEKLTGVPAARQKLMGVKDDLSKLKNGQKITLIGTAEKLEKPVEKVVFVEDMEGDEDMILNQLPAGLNNLGNTCYMNSCLQTLKNIPELTTDLQKFQQKNENDLSDKLTSRTKDLFLQLKKQNSTYSPISFVSAFRQAHTRFSQTVQTPMGETFAQQDADEFWNTLINSLKTDSKDLFKGEFEVTLKNVEAEEEVSTLKESFHKLPCEISKETSNVEFGLNQSLVTSIEKNSSVLGRNSVFTKISRISKLPNYLSINMVRFYWKSKEQVKAKVLKDVKFPLILDVFDLCSDELKKELKPNREILRKKRDDELLNKYKKEEEMKDEEKPSYEIKEFGGNSTGYYELFGLVTHKGRSADSGHYVGWVKEEGRWIKFDDDKVQEVSEDDIKKLSGGGDWHTSYILFYRSKNEKGEVIHQQ